MTSRAHFSFKKASEKNQKCKPSVRLSYDVENQDGCMEIAKWEIENNKLAPRTKSTLVLANKNIKSFSVKIGPEKHLVEIKWNAKTGILVSDDLHSGRYICTEMDSLILDQHIEFMARENPTYFCNAIIDIEFSHYPFFAEMVRAFTRSAKDANNFADPPNPAAIIDTINCDRQTYEFKSFKERTESIKGIRGYANINTRKGRSPERQYVIDLKLFQDRPEDYKTCEFKRTDSQISLISSDFATMYDTYRNRLHSAGKYSDKYSAATKEADKAKNEISNEIKSLGEVLHYYYGRKVSWFGKSNSLEADSESAQDATQTLVSPLYPSSDFNIFKNDGFSIYELSGDAKALNDLIVASERELAQSESNAHTYLTCRVPVQRGMDIEQDFLKGAIAIGANRSKLIDAIRDGVDKKLIPANHWEGLREDPGSETYQNIISNVMNKLSTECKIVNPITFIRSAIYSSAPKYLAIKQGKPTPTKSEYLKLLNTMQYGEGWKIYLQFGFGNCGEHAQTCYHAFKNLMDNGSKIDYKSLFKNIIYTGHLFIDHAFIVGGFELHDVKYRESQPRAMYWNIEDTLKELKKSKKDADAFVIDAYMQNVRSMNLEQFLNYLLTQQAQKDEDREKLKFARFVDQYPAPSPRVVLKA